MNAKSKLAEQLVRGNQYLPDGYAIKSNYLKGCSPEIDYIAVVLWFNKDVIIHETYQTYAAASRAIDYTSKLVFQLNRKGLLK